MGACHSVANYFLAPADEFVEPRRGHSVVARRPEVGEMAGTTSELRAVIFDFFGTLVDEVNRFRDPMLQEVSRIFGIDYDSFLAAFQSTDNPRSLGLYRDTEENLVDVCVKLGLHPEMEVIKLAANAFRSGFLSQMEPRPDALETIQSLKDRGLSIGLVSNINLEGPRLWGKTPFAPVIDVAIFSSVVRLTKPDPRIFQLALEGLRVTTGQCIYVGDGGSGELQAARALGMQAVMVRTNYVEDTYYLDEHVWPGPRIQTLREVLKLLPSGILRDTK